MLLDKETETGVMTQFVLHLCSFQIIHGMKQSTMRTNYQDRVNTFHDLNSFGHVIYTLQTSKK